MSRQRKRGFIQNEEVLIEALYGETLFIPCKDKKDAHSKGVSLNNAKNSRLSPDQQRKVRVQETELDGEWGVKIFPSSDIPVYKIVDGKKVLWNLENSQISTSVTISKSKLSTDNHRILELMLKDKKSTEEIVDTLNEEKLEDVLEAITLLTTQ